MRNVVWSLFILTAIYSFPVVKTSCFLLTGVYLLGRFYEDNIADLPWLQLTVQARRGRVLVFEPAALEDDTPTAESGAKRPRWEDSAAGQVNL